MERRKFVALSAGAALTTAALTGAQSQPTGAAGTRSRRRELPLEDGQKVLFQGDSITDAGRKKDDGASLGNGYAALTAAWISAQSPGRKVEFINRGISGNRVIDLKERWGQDCLDLKPDWVSILIGVNDTWRRYDSNEITTAEAFEAGYRDLLDRMKTDLTARVILCEPFLLHTKPEIEKMREDLDPKIAVVRKLSEEYKTLFVPLDEIFKEACEDREPAFWAADGVHPTMAGHALISQNWMRVIRQAG